MKITDVPPSNPSKARNYRCYKLQFQAPPNVGLFTWKVYFVSDTVVSGELCRDILVSAQPSVRIRTSYVDSMFSLRLRMHRR